jgi:hypothetical protein
MTEEQTSPTTTNPVREQVVELLKQHVADLSVKLNEYQTIQKDFILSTRALRALVGSNGNGNGHGPGRPRGPGKTPKTEQVNRGGGHGPSILELLTALAETPHGARPSEIAVQIGRPENKSHANVSLAYAAKRKLAKNKNGHYTITAAGRKYIAQGGARPDASPDKKLALSVKHSRRKRTDSTARKDRPSQVSVMTALGQLPEGGKAREITAKLGLDVNDSYYTRAVSVILPATYKRRLTTRKDGTYTLTDAGRKYLKAAETTQ